MINYLLKDRTNIDGVKEGFSCMLKAAKAGHESLTPNLAKKIIEGADYLKIARTLVHCAKDVAIPKMDISIPKRPADLPQIYAMQAEHGLGASIDRLISALKW